MIRNLKDVLNTLVDDYHFRTGVIDKLVESAYTTVITDLTNHASEGKTSADVRIKFPGCGGGYNQHRNIVTDRVRRKLQDAGVRVDKSSEQYSLRVEW